MIVGKLNGGRNASMTIIKTIMMNLIPSLYHGKTTVLYCNVVAYDRLSQNMFDIRTNKLPSDLQRQKYYSLTMKQHQ